MTVCFVFLWFWIESDSDPWSSLEQVNSVVTWSTLPGRVEGNPRQGSRKNCRCGTVPQFWEGPWQTVLQYLTEPTHKSTHKQKSNEVKTGFVVLVSSGLWDLDQFEMIFLKCVFPARRTLCLWVVHYYFDPYSCCLWLVFVMTTFAEDWPFKICLSSDATAEK